MPDLAHHPVAPALVSQPSLFGLGEPTFDPGFAQMTHVGLGMGAWLDLATGWLQGHEQAFDALRTRLDWTTHRRPMYDRIVDVPRLLGSDPSAGAGHPVLAAASDALSARYGLPLDEISFAMYRDGRDSVAWHGDISGRTRTRSVVATVSLGQPRPFVLRPTPNAQTGPRSKPKCLRFELGHGDLVVMGGTIQRTWQHAVPKTARAGTRIVAMFRHRTEAPVPDHRY